MNKKERTKSMNRHAKKIKEAQETEMESVLVHRERIVITQFSEIQ